MTTSNKPPSLRQRTLDFWIISTAWHQRPGADKITTSQALKCLGGHIDDTLYKHKRLASRMWHLKEEIIEGRPTRSKHQHA